MRNARMKRTTRTKRNTRIRRVIFMMRNSLAWLKSVLPFIAETMPSKLSTSADITSKPSKIIHPRLSMTQSWRPRNAEARAPG